MRQIRYMDCGIYMIKNNITCGFYIGKSAHLDARFKAHKRELLQGIHRSGHMQNSFNKYGLDSFSFTVLVYCEPFELHRYEQACVDAFDPPFNICKKCVDSPLGVTPSDETKRRMSESQKGNTNCLGHKPSEETRRRMSESLKGNTHTKGYKRSEEHTRKLVAANTGSKRSDATKLRMSLASAQKGHPLSEKQKLAISAANRGRPAYNKGVPLSEEQKRKISVSHKGMKVSDETRRRLSESLKGNTNTTDMVLPTKIIFCSKCGQSYVGKAQRKNGFCPTCRHESKLRVARAGKIRRRAKKLEGIAVKNNEIGGKQWNY